ncbi:phosphodiester glycosidase family protein [Kineococcus sp. SYSU DK002]|uniref:phosphodiester glycosidase family protein n=1 Tax=Kineococcus sp. SYSU DK002 TaxID=3383123 RepID=UPI003D7EC9FD
MVRRRTVLAVAAASAAGLTVRPAAAQTGPTATPLTTPLTTALTTETVAPGVTLERSTGSGPVRQALLRLAAGSTTRPVLLQHDLSSPRTPADLAAAGGAVAAVNGDFYDIDRTGTPDGPVVLDGRPLKASADPQGAVGIAPGPAGTTGRVGSVQLDGTVTLGGRTHALAALATRTVAPGTLALFPPAWGAGDRSLTTTPDVAAVEVEVRAGAVTAVRAPGPAPVPADGFVLVGTGALAPELSALAVGTAVTSDVRVRVDALPAGSTGFAVGARLELVRDGAPAPFDTTDPTWAALRARTAVGWTAGGDLLLLTVEGGTAASVGVTATDTARRMVAAGAVGAVMLDGGGSAQLVARRPGDAHVSEAVVPSDGAARPVAHAIGLVPASAGPEAAAVVLRPELAAARVLPGLAQALRVVPVSASGAPTAGTAVLTSTGPGVLAVETAGRVLVRGVRPGPAAVQARLGAAAGRLDVEVLGPPVRFDVDAPPALPGPGSTLEVTVTGHDAAGRWAPVDAADVRVEVDAALLRCEPLPDGRLRLTAVAAGPVPVAVGLSAVGVTSVVEAAIGTRPVLLDRLGDPAGWTVAATRATASLTLAPGPALRLAYDFTGQPAGTSTAALVARTPVLLPSGSTALALRVRGDGQGGWLRAVLRVDGAQRPVTFAARVDFTDVRRLEVPVPAGAREVAVERVYLAQTQVAARRAGAVEVAQLEASVPPLRSRPARVDRHLRHLR